MSTRLLSRSTLTVQDVTVCSVLKPTLPLIDTSRCSSRPHPDAAWQPTKRRERFRCIFEHVRGRPTNALRGLVRTIVSYLSIRPCGSIHMDIVPLHGAAFIPMPKGGGLSPRPVREESRWKQ